MTHIFNERIKNITDVEGMLPVVSQPYLYSVAEGDIPGHTLIRKLGRQSAVSTAQIDLWGVASVLIQPAAAMQMSVKSTDNDQDKAAGTGALTVAIDYLDATYTPKTTTVTLNGTTWVDTTPTDLFRIQAFHVLTAGTGGYPVGDITIADKATRAIVYDQVSIGYNRSLRAAWTVPLGKTLYVTSWMGCASSGASKYAEFQLRSQSHEGVASSLWNGHDILIVQDGSAQSMFDAPLIIPATATVKMSVKGSGTLSAAGHFQGWYE